jgi:hypothetical protein
LTAGCIDIDEVVLTHPDDDPKGAGRPGGFSFTAQGVLHGANEAFGAEFQAARTPGMRRTRTGIGVDTYRPLNVSPVFARMTR